MHGATRMPTPPTRSQRPCLTSCLLIYRLGPATLIGHVSSECGGLIAVYHLTAYPGPLNRSRTDVAPTAGATLERLYPYLNDFLRFCINRKGYGSLGAAAVLRTNDGDNPSMLHGPEHAAYEPSAYSTLGTAELFTLHHSWHDPDFLNAYLGTLPAQGEVLIGRGRPRPGRPRKGVARTGRFCPIFLRHSLTGTVKAVCAGARARSQPVRSAMARDHTMAFPKKGKRQPIKGKKRSNGLTHFLNVFPFFPFFSRPFPGVLGHRLSACPRQSASSGLRRRPAGQYSPVATLCDGVTGKRPSCSVARGLCAAPWPGITRRAPKTSANGSQLKGKKGRMVLRTS